MSIPDNAELTKILVAGSSEQENRRLAGILTQQDGLRVIGICEDGLEACQLPSVCAQTSCSWTSVCPG